MNTLTEEQIAKYLDRLTDLTKNYYRTWKMSVVYAQNGAHVFDCDDGEYHVHIICYFIANIPDPGSVELWLGKGPIERPYDWRQIHPLPTENMTKLMDVIRKHVGLNNLLTGENGFDIDEFINVMKL
jgi:hypothetical protein